MSSLIRDRWLILGSETLSIRGVATGVYIGIYTPKMSNRFVHVWDINTSFEIAIRRYGVQAPFLAEDIFCRLCNMYDL